MSRRLTLLSTMILFAIVSAAFGCSNAPASAPMPLSGARGINEKPQSVAKWITRPHMHKARYWLAAGVVNGVLFAIGGAGGNNASNTVEAFDATTNTWTTKAPMQMGRAGLVVDVINGVLYAVGGDSSCACTVEAYNPTTDTWTSKAPMPTGRYYPAGGVVNGILYVVGGYSTNGPGYLNTVEAYDPATD